MVMESTKLINKSLAPKHHHNRVYNQQESWSDQQRKRYRLQNYVGLYVRTYVCMYVYSI